jgi:hypothetical protein
VRKLQDEEQIGGGMVLVIGGGLVAIRGKAEVPLASKRS